MKLRNSALVLPLLLAAGCSSPYIERESIVVKADQDAAVVINAPASVKERLAYEKGVQDILVDMKGKMSARDRFVWSEPIVDCGVQIPSRVVNGMLIPSHEACVQIAPGRWTEEAPTYLPALEQ